MNPCCRLICIFPLLLFTLGTPKYALSAVSDEVETIYERTLHFEGFSDPGILETQSGEEYFFGYRGFEFDLIRNWKPGRPLKLTYSHERGAHLLDESSGIFSPLRVQSVVDYVLNHCLDENQSTMGMRECYEERYQLWMQMIDRLLSEIKHSFPREESERVLEAHAAWEVYKQKASKMSSGISANDPGTISIVESAARAENLVRAHALFLEALVFDR